MKKPAVAIAATVIFLSGTAKADEISLTWKAAAAMVEYARSFVPNKREVAAAIGAAYAVDWLTRQVWGAEVNNPLPDEPSPILKVPPCWSSRLSERDSCYVIEKADQRCRLANDSVSCETNAAPPASQTPHPEAGAGPPPAITPPAAAAAPQVSSPSGVSDQTPQLAQRMRHRPGHDMAQTWPHPAFCRPSRRPLAGPALAHPLPPRRRPRRLQTPQRPPSLVPSFPVLLGWARPRRRARLSIRRRQFRLRRCWSTTPECSIPPSWRPAIAF